MEFSRYAWNNYDIFNFYDALHLIREANRLLREGAPPG
jgi:hypothetical protein